MAVKLVDKINLQNQALKLRIYPTIEQEILINKTFGCVRKVYNNRIAEKQAFYENVIKPEENAQNRKELWKTAHYSSEKDLKEQFPYLKEVSAQALCSATLNAEKAYSNFLNSFTGKRKGGKVGKPKFKSKKLHNYSYRECQPSKTAWNRGNKTIKIPKLGEVKYRHKGDFNNFFTVKGVVLKSITVRRNPADEYYAILLFEREYIRKPKVYSDDESKVVGLDFSPVELYIDSNGNSGKNFGYVAQKQVNARKPRILKRKLAKKQKGSNNHEKARIKFARLENHISNSRLDFIEKETLRLARSYEIIGVEDLNLQGISSFLRNAKNMVDTSWGMFVNKLVWKASKNEHNCQVIKVSRHFPSSKICSKCGFQYKELKLSERKWVCPSCGIKHNRDLNAAINLKDESIRLAKSELRPVEDYLFKRNRNFPGNLGNPVKQETGIFQSV
jgi:putative transposase